MDLNETRDLAIELMGEWGLYDWTFQFDNSKRRFGYCRFTPQKRISLSRYLVELNGRDEVEDVIRHEIAHAIAGHEAGHGPRWRQWCLDVGARPERCYESEAVARPPAPWRLVCSGCGYSLERYRRSRREFYHSTDDRRMVWQRA